MRFVVRVLAVIGAVAVVVTVAAGAWLWSVSRPSGRPPATAPSETSSTQASSAQADLRQVRATIAGLSRSGTTTTLDGIDAVGVVPFSVVQRRAGSDVRIGHDGHGRVTLAAPVNALGRTVDVQAVGAVSPDGRDVVIEPVSIGLGGSGLLDGVLGQAARAAVTIREPIEGLPAGLTVTKIDVADDGFHVHVVGERVSAS